MKSLYILIGITIFILFTNSITFGEESSSAFRIARSEAEYLYFAKGDLCDSPEGGTKLIFKQSDFEVGIDTPKNYLGIFYVNAGINFTTLTQDKQEVCFPGGSESRDVPEKAFLHTRELLLTIGTELGFVFIDISVGQMGIKGNYYLDNVRYDTDEAFPFFKINGTLQFDLFSWGHYGVELSSAANPPRSDYTDGYINYNKISGFLKILF
jgi:hypothetical protein